MTAPPPIITVSDLHLSFGGLAVLTGFSLEVPAGRTLGLVGPNGAGKTSLLNCISRVYLQQKGSIVMGGIGIDRKRPDQVARMGVARTFQSTTAFREIKVIDLLMLGRHVRLTPTFASYLVGVPALRGYERAERRRCEELLHYLGLEALAQAEVGELPYGQAKLVDLARALASEPRVLLLDEPASGLAADGRLRMARVLRQIPDEFGITQVVVEHDMNLVKQVCDRLVVMKDGTKIADGEPEAVLAERPVVEALLG